MKKVTFSKKLTFDERYVSILMWKRFGGLVMIEVLFERIGRTPEWKAAYYGLIEETMQLDVNENANVIIDMKWTGKKLVEDRSQGFLKIYRKDIIDLKANDRKIYGWIPKRGELILWKLCGVYIEDEKYVGDLCLKYQIEKVMKLPDDSILTQKGNLLGCEITLDMAIKLKEQFKTKFTRKMRAVDKLFD